MRLMFKFWKWIQLLIPKRSISFKVPIIYYYKFNLNDRYYTLDSLPVDILEKKLKSIGFVGGQIGYPDSFEVSISKMSHVFTKFYIKDDILWGEGRTLKTWEGQKLNWLILANKIVFRPRSAGHVLESGEVEIEQVFAIDAVNKNQDSFAIQVDKYEV